MVETEHTQADQLASIINIVTEVVKDKEPTDEDDNTIASTTYGVDKSAVTRFLTDARNPVFTRAVMQSHAHWEDVAKIHIVYFQDREEYENYAIELELSGDSSRPQFYELNHILTLSTSGKNTIETYFDPHEEFGDLPVEERDATPDDISRFNKIMLGLQNALRE